MYSLPRSKSLSSLNEVSFHDYPGHSASASISSIEEYIVNDENDLNDHSGLNYFGDKNDSGLGGDVIIAALENKIEELNVLYMEQCRLLVDVKDEIRCTKEDPAGHSLAMELLLKATELNSNQVESRSDAGGPSEKGNARAQSLLDALQSKRGVSLDREIAQALVDFLQDEDLKQRVVAASVASIQSTIQKTLSNDLMKLYMPTLQRCHRRLIRHVTNVLERAFMQLQRNTASWPYKSSRWMLSTLQRHQQQPDTQQLRNEAQRILETELQQWRLRALETVMSPEPTYDLCESPEDAPRSPRQPADPGTCIIDQMMMTAEINKGIQDGDINGSFEKALSASDLSLVMAACRAVDPSLVFSPTCCLQSHVRLSLLQQLATDMLHETQLKCRYLEETLISLNTSSDAATSAFLPLVIADARKHLTNFLAKYPSHVASRRVMLIIMAGDNLIK